MTEISVVIPVYACAKCLEPLRDRLVTVLEKMDLTFEVIFVEDGGPDDSWTRLKRLAADDPRIRALRLSRNFGQHAAITAGLERARGEWAVDVGGPAHPAARRRHRLRLHRTLQSEAALNVHECSPSCHVQSRRGQARSRRSQLRPDRRR